MADRVNRLNRVFTAIFTQGMQSLKPSDPRAEDYGEKIRKWQKAFSFPQKVRNYVNKLNNMIVLAGEQNTSDELNTATKEFVEKLRDKQSSDEFNNIMELVKPNIEGEQNYDEKIKIWENAFNFRKKLENFTDFLDKKTRDSHKIEGEEFLQLIDGFINDLEESAEDPVEFLITETDDIGGQKFNLNHEKIKDKATEDVDSLISKLDKNNKIVNMPIKERELFEDCITKFKESELEVKATKKIIEKKYDDFKIDSDIDDEKNTKVNPASKKKTYARNMNLVAGAGLIVIAFLMFQSVACIGMGGPGTCFIEDQIVKGEEVEVVKTNPYTQILESNVMLVLVSTVIAPIVARILKDKFDIDVEAKQIAMIMSDGIKSVTMYAKEADRLRDENGHIPRKYQKVLRNKAFKVIKENYGQDKYKDLVANVGAQVFEKAIEDAVAKGKLERFPLEKEQVEAIIKQSIDAVPQIVKWKDLDDEVKLAFIDGNVRKLLQNVGAEGWAYKKLENVFDSEVSKRLLAAAIADKEGLLIELDPDDPLRYVSTTADTVFTTLAKH